MPILSVRMSETEYDKLKKDAISLGFVNPKDGEAAVSDYVRFLNANAKVKVSVEVKK